MKKFLIILFILVMSISLFSCDLFNSKPINPNPEDPVIDDPIEEDPIENDPLNEYYKEQYKNLYDQFSIYYTRCENAGLESAIDNNPAFLQYMDEIYTSFTSQFTYNEENNTEDYYSLFLALSNFYNQLTLFINDPVNTIDEYNEKENGKYESDIVIETNGLWPSKEEYFFNRYIPSFEEISKFTLVYHKDDYYSYEIQVPNVSEEDFENFRVQIIQNLAIHFEEYKEYNVYYTTYSDHDVDITISLQMNGSTLLINVANFIYD